MSEDYVWKIAAIDRASKMKLTKSKKEVISGFYFHVFKILQEKMKFRYEIVQPVPKEFLEKKNGTYYGISGQVINKEADMTAIPLFMTSNESELADFTSLINVHSISFIIKQRKVETSWQTITRPFPIEVWIAIIISTIVAGFFISRILTLENNLHKFKNIWTIQDGIWFTFTNMSRQGFNINPVIGFSSRLTVGIWLLGVSVLGYGYGGILMSFLTAPQYEWIPNNFHELSSAVERGEFSCGTFSNGRDLLFQGAETGIANTLRNHIDVNQNYMQVFDATTKIKNEHFAFIGAKPGLIRKLKRHLKDRIIISDDSLLSFNLAFLVRKQFPFKKEINRKISHLFESGIISYQESKLDPPENSIDEDILAPLNMTELFGSFILLIIGCLFSLLCFIGEVLTRKTKEADMTAIPLFMTSNESELADFTSLINVHSISFIIKQRKVETSWQTITRPFPIEREHTTREE
ncbi:glutamate receptor ionotropic, kainate 5-like [Centruroides sculpturatus]|uniref:glutamate receptor ionotropic, kainate 5-like n=1 Tax=Centruroides sculpturatus TaxID=218467 RepID=UPI000C6E3BA4|nr:glutamate receptor ionotropic, kainate 5-like [Centruroides sculpturatus]